MAILLIILLFLPLVGAVIVAVLGSKRADAVRWTALGTTVATLVLAIIATVSWTSARLQGATIDPVKASTFRPEYVTQFNLLQVRPASSDSPAAVIQFYIGLDGMNIWLILLTVFLMVPSVLVSWNAVKDRVNEYYAWLLFLATGMIGVFLAFDVILFYVFFELSLVPLFFLIGIWGGPDRDYAAKKFFVYTLTGSLLTLVGILALVLTLADRTPKHELTFSIPRLVELLNIETPKDYPFWRSVQGWVFLALFAGFAVKVPLVPLHTWLPLAHVEAPTAGSVLLAGVLLKLGTYGFMRLTIPLTPDASLALGVPLISYLAVIGVIYGAFCALAQDDVKRLVAYSSVSHLGFAMVGLFALNEVGMAGSLLQMINHGLSTGALFLLVGMLYERYHTRHMEDYGGMATKLKVLAVFMMIITLASIGLPGLNGFVGEFLVLAGMWTFSGSPVNAWMITALTVTGVLLGAWYMLTMMKQVFFGPFHEPHHDGPEPVKDLDAREWSILAPIVAACLFLGVYPQPVLDSIKPEMKLVSDITAQAQKRFADAHAGVPVGNNQVAANPAGE
jgi:NADH-quinone oxidoreductase subunit M